MTIPRWRLALMVGALVAFGAISGGLVQAANTPPASTAATSATEGDGRAFRAAQLEAVRARLGSGFLDGLRQRLVHGTLTVLDRTGKLVTIQLDHGTVSAIGAASITIEEAGGSSVTVATNDETCVRKDRKPASLTNLEVDDQVVVHSIVEGADATAQVIRVLPPAAPTSGGGAGR